VPLHRRGTSKTYERLEDLLREAGYKDTRVFTPEGEHREEAADESRSLKDDAEKRSSIRGGVDAVVGFLAGLMPSTISRSSSLRRHDSYDGPSSTEPSSPSPTRPYSPPSPLAHRQAHKQKPRTPLSSEPHSPTTMTSSIESLEHTPRPKHKSPPRSSTPVPPNIMYSHSQPMHNASKRPQHQLVHRISDQSTYTLQRPLLHPQTSRTSLRQQGPASATGMRIAQPRPSRASAYLRHMVSQPDIPKRPNSTPAHPPRRTFLLNDSDSDITRSAYNDNDPGYEHPPLPRTWLENVTRAVLFGGMGTYVGGPSGPPSIIEPEYGSFGKTLRPTRSSISQVSPKYLRPQQSRSGLSDRTNTRSVASVNLLAPPELFTRIERGRARKSAGEVSRTRVVCRSAPVSRVGSPTGSGGEGKQAKRARYGKEREPARGRGRRDEKNRLPSLASTKTEGDVWNKKQTKPLATGGNRYLSGWGMDFNSDDGDDEGRSSSEDDGELNLAQMLVPPKRQNSIKSLRKHLDPSSSTGAGPVKGVSRVRGAPVGAGGRNVRQRIAEDEWGGSDTEDWGSGWVRKGSRKNSGDEDEDVAYPGFLVDGRGFGLKNAVLGSGRSATGKRRVGLPAPWGLIGGGS
jgi:hypothetical protein